ncbi:MAG: DUF4870 domain-containing protein [Oscillatoriales cyanobacterium]|nr:MAG: DUF4870 domain-containing protein [Oscillatoriales cyanobacterium]TAH23102.1 MAG: DUF4870 domain-containing protein [Oscillatoriales cyanobacterium]
MTELPDLQKRKLLSALCHLSTLLSWAIVPFAVPIIVLCVSDDEIIQQNAKEAINYYVSFILYYSICFLLLFVVIGFPLLILVIIADYVLPIMAIVHCLTNLSKPYHYPFIFRVV